ncbi:family 31 glycosyltransferase [Cryphonectria parasitica EP155]|uniref:Family 31 glycosyltransferase n=1 Tax=Cryphonectria parasitica (strain ATCC 38755 / EP155) TaxID=660469 RepID=A0A9P5CM68_CRYP1|nr:family 31 glycosyltransferase [Cryphonectria parasitica EP155]KAF3762771.1 family 31 glycosyltransferase [Cryphonectria parasitica EP155]
MLIPQRFHRIVPAVVVLFLCLFLLSSTRFRDAALNSSITTKLTGTDNGGGNGAEKSQAALEEEAKFGTPPGGSTLRPPLAPGQCSPDIEFLRRQELGLTDNILYSRRCVTPKFSSNIDREAITRLDTPLMTDRTTINLTSCSHVESLPCEPLTIPVPPAYPKQTFEHFIFGVATYHDRMIEALPAFDHWLAGSGAPLVAVIVDHALHDLSALESLFEQHNIKLITVHGEPQLTIDQNHFITLRPTVQNIGPQTKWVGILDDDTFFPSLYALSDAFSVHDHTKEVWLGQLSEDFYSVRSWGFFAYGGAGVFLSVPLAKKLEPFQEQCLEEAALPSGDGMLRDCVYYHSKTKLTLVPGLHQQDMRGDLSGFFEAGLKPLSLHHWKSWYEEPVFRIAEVAKLCGDCFLQRFQFGEDTLFSNGYSIALYRKGLQDLNLDWMEATWNQHGPEFDFSIGPLRPALKKHEKRSYRLKDAEWLADGRLRQIYVYKRDWQSGEEMDEVIELLWDPSGKGSH